MIRYIGYNFNDIRSIIEAAENLQNAGKSDDCEKIMHDLANDIKTEGEIK